MADRIYLARDKTWKGVRAEVPWVTRTPSEIIRNNVRFTVQPVDAADDGEAIMRLADDIKSDELFLFSTDYPHWTFGREAVPLPAGSLMRFSARDTASGIPLAAFTRDWPRPGGCAMSTVELERPRASNDLQAESHRLRHPSGDDVPKPRCILIWKGNG